jgi:hypothetical protein
MKLLCVTEDLARHSRRVIWLHSSFPQRPLWSGDMLEVPNTVLGRAGWKNVLVRVAGDGETFGAPQIPIGDALGT